MSKAPNMQFFLAILLLCSASSMAAKKGLRGVARSESASKKQRNLKKGGNCSQQSMQQAQPVQCLSGEAAMFSFRECAWVCKTLPETSPQNPAFQATVPETRSAATTPYQTNPTTRKGGKGGLCQYDPALHPMEPCPEGYSAMFNHRDCEWQCKFIADQMMNAPQTRSASTPYQATPSEPYDQATPTTRKGGKGGSLCQYDPQLHPMQPCPEGYSVMFNHKDCEWQCKFIADQMMRSSTTPQTRSYVNQPVAPATTRKGSSGKGGSKGSELCQYDPALHPMQPCPVGYSAMFNHKDCEWQCKDIASQQQRLGTPQTRSYVAPQTQQQAQASTTTTTTTTSTYQAPAVRKGGNKGCSSERMGQATPVSCAQGEAAMLSFRECAWVCKVLPASPESATVETKQQQQQQEQPLECPEHHISFFNKSTGNYECMAVPDMECPRGQHMLYDHEGDNFYCGH